MVIIDGATLKEAFNVAVTRKLSLSYVLEKGFEGHSGVDEEKCDSCSDSNSGGTCSFNNNLNQFDCLCEGQYDGHVCSKAAGLPKTLGRYKSEQFRVVTGVTAVTIVAVVICAVWWLMHKSGCQEDIDQEKSVIERNHDNEDDTPHLMDLSAKRWTWSDIEKITNNRSSKLGQGGFGDVYRGVLNDCDVAVKILRESREDHGEFINEAESMIKTSHKSQERCESFGILL